jgi:hypothetical protein
MMTFKELLSTESSILLGLRYCCLPRRIHSIDTSYGFLGVARLIASFRLNGKLRKSFRIIDRCLSCFGRSFSWQVDHARRSCIFWHLSPFFGCSRDPKGRLAQVCQRPQA